MPNSGVTTIPVVRPNAILVLAAEEEMPAVRKLIQELDQPIVPETEYQVFQLQHTTPARVEEMGRYARHLAETRFSWMTVAGLMKPVFEEVVAR